jgi:hypothetical protein
MAFISAFLEPGRGEILSFATISRIASSFLSDEHLGHFFGLECSVDSHFHVVLRFE